MLILTNCWNTPYQYELNKLKGATFHYLRWPGSSSWGPERPFDPQTKLVNLVDLKSERYDCFLVHFDKIVPASDLLQIPVRKRVLVCHGIPPESPITISQEPVIDAKQSNVIGNEVVVFPNRQTQEMWAVKNSRVIEPTLSFWHYPIVKKSIQGIISEVPFEFTGNSFQDFYGRMQALGQYSCYLNTNQTNPWTTNLYEAMLLGSAVVTTKHFNEQEIVRHGVDGFLSNEVSDLDNFTAFLMQHPKTAVEMGNRARMRAVYYFKNNPFLEKWGRLLQ